MEARSSHFLDKSDLRVSFSLTNSISDSVRRASSIDFFFISLKVIVRIASQFALTEIQKEENHTFLFAYSVNLATSASK